MNKCLYFLFFSFLLMGCRHGDDKINRQLTAIDSLLAHEQVDSALHEINRVDTTSMSDAVRAYYELLRVQTHWKAYIPVESDTLLNFSLNYYKSHGPEERLARTYYYIAEIQREDGHVNAAVENLKLAEQMARRTDDLLLKNKIYSGLYNVNHDAGEYVKSLEYARMALDCSKQLNIPENLLVDYENMGVAYHFVGNQDSALYSFEQCLPLVKYVDKKDQAHVLANLGVYYRNLNRLERAEEVLQQSISAEPLDIAYRSLARICLDKRDFAQADVYYREALRLNEKLDERVRILQGYRKLQEQQGNFHAANELASEINQLKDSIGRQRQAESVGMQQQGIEHQTERQELSGSRRRIAVAAALLLVLLVLTLAYYFRWKRRVAARMAEAQRVIAENAKDMAELQESLRQQSEQLTAERSEKARLKAEHTKAVSQAEQKLKEVQKAEKQLLRIRQRLDLLKEKQMEAVNQMMKEHGERLKHGRELHDQLEAGSTMVRWQRQDYSDFRNFYVTLVNPQLLFLLETDGKPLTPRQCAYIILEDMGMEQEEIERRMVMTGNSRRTMLSRMKLVS